MAIEKGVKRSCNGILKKIIKKYKITYFVIVMELKIKR